MLYSCAIALIWNAANHKRMREYRDYRIVAAGTIFSMYLSWLVIYMANANPFIEPIFSKK
ncbi:hypothetical protein ENBRE01_0482 [Enteropsectra breve]|nr:hypothetical protein ENBRE01_0482 [Enteropsectra breve]